MTGPGDGSKYPRELRAEAGAFVLRRVDYMLSGLDQQASWTIADLRLMIRSAAESMESESTGTGPGRES
jgi:hypothetical protein